MESKYHKAFQIKFDGHDVFFFLHYNLCSLDDNPMQVTAQWWVDVNDPNDCGQFFMQQYCMPNETSALSFMRDYSITSAQALVDAATIL